jgi:fucose permease
VAFYGAYAVLAIFAAVLAEELSYRKGVLIGLAIYIAGALLYIPACIAQSFNIYFVAIFIVAGGCSLLETTCNPYVLSLGSRETAVRRLNFAQMFNPVGSMAGIVLAQQLILSHLNPATADERARMAPDKLKAIIDHANKITGTKHTLHDTRHTFISAAERSGLDANSIILKRIVGHSTSGNTTAIYTHKNIDDLLTAIDKIALI